MTGANSVASFQKRHSRRSFDKHQMRTRRATSQIGKSRRNGEAAMRVLRHWASQGARSRSLFVFTEIYPRVAPIWGSALPWMVYFTFTFELKNAAEMTNVRWSQKAAAMAVGKEAQQRRQSQKLRRVQQRVQQRSQKPRSNSAGRRQRQSQRQLICSNSASTAAASDLSAQLHHSMPPPPQHPRRHVQGISSP